MTPFLICLKRDLKNIFFLIILIIMPLMALGFNALDGSISKKPAVGLYFNCNHDYIFNRLNSKTVDFLIYNNKDNMAEDISLGKIDSGYVFEEKFDKAFESLDFKESVDYIVSASSALQPVTNEFIYKEILKEITPEIADSFFEGKIAADKYYEEFLNSDSVFNIEFEIVNNNVNEDKKGYSISNIFAVFIMIGTLMTAVNVIKDRKKGIRIYNFIYILSTAFILMLSGICAMAVSGELLISSIPLYALYIISISILSYISAFINNAEIVCGILPVITILSFIICPVVFDIGSINLYYGYISYILPVTYFIRGDLIGLGIYTVILSAAAYLLKRIICL